MNPTLWGRHCHLGGLVPNCGNTGWPLGAEFHLVISLHGHCLQIATKMPQLGFVKHQVKVALWCRPYPDQWNMSCWLIKQTLNDHSNIRRYQKAKTRINSNSPRKKRNQFGIEIEYVANPSWVQLICSALLLVQQMSVHYKCGSI